MPDSTKPRGLSLTGVSNYLVSKVKRVANLCSSQPKLSRVETIVTKLKADRSDQGTALELIILLQEIESAMAVLLGPESRGRGYSYQFEFSPQTIESIVADINNHRR